MTKITQETAALLDSLPAEKAQAVLDFARYSAYRVEVEAWERTHPSPKARVNAKNLARRVVKGKSIP